LPFLTYSFFDKTKLLGNPAYLVGGQIQGIFFLLTDIFGDIL